MAAKFQFIATDFSPKKEAKIHFFFLLKFLLLLTVFGLACRVFLYVSRNVDVIMEQILESDLNDSYGDGRVNNDVAVLKAWVQIQFIPYVWIFSW